MASRRLNRALRGTLTAGMTVALVVGIGHVPASGDPDTPGNTSEEMKRLREVSLEAEKLTEQLHQATDELTAKQRELAEADRAVAEAGKAKEAALIEDDKHRGRVDQLAGSSFQGTGTTQLSALLASASPRQYLETMSRLDMIATDEKRAIDGLSQAIHQTEAAERSAAENRSRSEQATQEAARIKGEIVERKKAADAKVAEAKAAVTRLPPTEAKRLKTAEKAPPVAGSGLAVAALNRALTRVGSKYVWGATGPDTFDCSGLVLWSYQQAGRSMPRSSREQAGVGAAVGRDAVRAGDLIFLGSPVHHVGIAVDGERYVHAPQAGDVVRIAPIPWKQVSQIRRVG